MELSKRIEELLEENDFIICGEISERYHENGTYDIELETYSPAGEDVIVSLIYDGTEEDFIRAFDEYANDFDADEHATNWIEARGMVRGVPNSVRDLIEDAEWIKDTLMRIAEELIRLDDEPEKLNVMNREQFYDYIVENFNISGEAGRLIQNILYFVEENYTKENEQYKALCDLLDGTIGLTDAEIRKVYM